MTRTLRIQHHPAAAAAAPGVASVAEGGFYFCSKTSLDQVQFADTRYREYNDTVLPASFLARTASGHNPGRNPVRTV